MIASKQCVIFTDFAHQSLSQSEYVADVLLTASISPSSTSIYWFDLTSSFNLRHSDTNWHDLPRLDEGTPRANPRVRSNTTHPRSKDKPTSTHGDEITMPKIDWNETQVIVSTTQTFKVDAVCYRLHGYFSLIGKTPREIRIVIPQASGYRTETLPWDDVVHIASHERLSRRFRSIYSFNFRAIAGNAIKSSVAMEPTSAPTMPSFEDRLKTASTGGFRTEFLQLLYKLTHVPSVPYGNLSSAPDFVHVIRTLLGEGENWMTSFMEVFNHYFPPRPDPAPQITYWKGSGRYPALSGNYSDFVYSGTFQAASHALQLGFVRASPETGILLTSSGRNFIERLSHKLEDVDAPIRWQKIDQTNLNQSDVWLKKHFQLLKRSISRH